MRCKNCQYSLSGLVEHRCPECGNEFNPEDERTYLPAGYVPLSRSTFLLICLVIYLAFAAFVLLRVRGHYTLMLVGGAIIMTIMFGLLHVLHWANQKSNRLKL